MCNVWFTYAVRAVKIVYSDLNLTITVVDLYQYIVNVAIVWAVDIVTEMIRYAVFNHCTNVYLGIRVDV